jgi:hypothetical protein
MVDRHKEPGDQDRLWLARSGRNPEGRTACGHGLQNCVRAALGLDQPLQGPVQPSGRIPLVADGLHSRLLQKSLAEQKA